MEQQTFEVTWEEILIYRYLRQVLAKKSRASEFPAIKLV